MMIDKGMIAEQKVVGKTKDNTPVLYVMTHGGLFGFFTKSKGGQVETLATAPHKAIAAWMAEKKAGGIKWQDSFTKSEDGLEDLKKSQMARFERYRSLIFNTHTTDLQKSDYYLIYDLKKSDIGLLTKDEIVSRIKGLSDQDLKRYIVRNTSLSDRADLLAYHEEFQ